MRMERVGWDEVTLSVIVSYLKVKHALAFAHWEK